MTRPAMHFDQPPHIPETATRQLADWVQVDAEVHYDPMKYLRPERMASIGYQFRLMHEYFPKSRVLEVGAGAGLTTVILRQLGHEVQTLDVDEKLSPSILGSVTSIPCKDDSLDAFLCSQVLEHLPWNEAQVSIRELARVAKRGGVISVPTMRPCFGILMHAWRRHGARRFSLPSFGKPRIRCPDQHYWELGAGVTLDQFNSALKDAGFNIAYNEQPVLHLYHHFFVVTKT
ncbi:MAG: class I SAM-dependent methyltransferase [Pirellulales bacterium]